MNGVLNILKPPGMTSFDVVAYLRGVLKTKKVGHTGTLDPGAVGVLPVCSGTATKAIEYITGSDKLYRAELTLGITTDTQDSYGNIIASKSADISSEEITRVINTFKGQYSQLPPMYSAVKINGKRLYDLARRGLEVERIPRNVVIHSINILDIKKQPEKGSMGSTTVKVMFDVECSKGTYIRTLCHDIGEKLGCGGHLSFLLRLKAGMFDIYSAVTLEEVEEASTSGTLGDIVISIDKIFDSFDAIVLDESRNRMFQNGMAVNYVERGSMPGKILRVYSPNKDFIALGQVIERNGHFLLKSKKRF
ncbi:MAG: tRNA pseudouridine(55) synthase TruB [Acetivibrionales bacterium]|jgi:tRNA pseudouridine55 synthase